MWKRFERYIDITLFHQMFEMIYQLSTVKDKANTYKSICAQALFMGHEMQLDSMEEVYELKYPGEVLERLVERTELTTQKVRALSLALVLTKDFQDERMFVGNQLTNFLKKVQILSESDDLYLLGISYLLIDKKDLIYERIVTYQYKNIEEIIFILSIFPDDDGLWESLRAKLNQYIGIDKSIDVFEDTGIYIWIARNLGQRIKGYRKKDLEILKSITRLPFVYAHEKNTIGMKLRRTGYSEAEVIYLNLILAKYVKLPDTLVEHKITIEKMAVNACQFYLSSITTYAENIYKFCKELFMEFREFEIKISGAKGIVSMLKPILKVNSVAAYQFLYQFRKWEGVNEEWFFVDLTDKKWFPLFEWLDRETFEKLVDATLSRKEYQKDELKLYLKNYDQLTGKVYLDTFWEQYSIQKRNIFIKLAELSLLEPLSIMRDYVNEWKCRPDSTSSKWKSMTKYLLEYVKTVQTPETYELLKMVDEELGIVKLDEIFHKKNILFTCLGIQGWEDRFQNLDLIRVYLTKEENYQVFLMLEQQIFLTMPEYYIEFVIHIISDTNNFLWLPKEEACMIFRKLIQLDVEINQLNRLCEIYLTEKELKERELDEKRQQERAEWMKEMKQQQEVKQKFNQFVATGLKSGNVFQKVKEFLNRCYWREETIAIKSIVAFLKARYMKEVFVLTKKETQYLFNLLGKIYEQKGIQFLTVKKIIDNIVEEEIHE